jgi:hypothetical protein
MSLRGDEGKGVVKKRGAGQKLRCVVPEPETFEAIYIYYESSLYLG